MDKKTIYIKGNIWLEADSDLQIGKGRYQLLQMIDKTGSIQGAVKVLNISYRKGWAMVKDMNSKAKDPLVCQKTGGKHGGGACLTSNGFQMKNAYEKLNEAFEQFKMQTQQILMSNDK